MNRAFYRLNYSLSLQTKLHPMYKALLSLFLLFMSANFQAQTLEEIKLNLRKDVIDLLHESFKLNEFFEFKLNFSTSEFRRDLSTLPDVPEHNEAYFQDLLEELKQNPTSAILHNSLAEYYKQAENFAKMNDHYKLAKEFLSFNTFVNDTASYYSFRGLLKMNLGDTLFKEDFDRALHINPNNEIAVNFYPMVLIYENKHEITMNYLIDAVQRGGDEKTYYFFLALNDFFRVIQQESLTSSSITYQEINAQDWFPNRDKMRIADSAFKSLVNEEIDLLRLFFVWSNFQNKKFEQITIDQKEYQMFKKEVKAKIKQLTKYRKKEVMNAYLYHKSMLYCYLFLENQKQANTHFELAIKAFPNSKQDLYFNTIDLFSQQMAFAVLREDFQAGLDFSGRYISNKSYLPSKELASLRLRLLMATERYDQASNEALVHLEKYNTDYNASKILLFQAFKKGNYLLADKYIKVLENSISTILEQYVALVFLSATFYCVGEYEYGIKLLENAENLSNEHKLNKDEAESLHFKLKAIFNKYN